MFELPGRKFFRSPFPQGQPPGRPDSSPKRAQVQNSPGGGSSIADANTQKTPSFPFNPLRDSSIADAETQETPSFPLYSFRDSSIADADTQEILSFPPIPSYIPRSVPVPKKTGRVRISKRRKILLLVLIVALLAPSVQQH